MSPAVIPVNAEVSKLVLPVARLTIANNPNPSLPISVEDTFSPSLIFTSTEDRHILTWHTWEVFFIASLSWSLFGTLVTCLRVSGN
ncbi:hypothetical protein CI102_10579 [Trichoderma harzianum]|nr:hypothetical protein CI102_10579 [Trichoderma harzianum]